MKARETTWSGLFIFILILFGGCKDSGNRDTFSSVIYGLETAGQSIFPDPNNKWKEIINAQLNSLPDLYTANAYVIKADGTLIQNKEALIDHYRKKAYKIDIIAAKKRIIAVQDSTIVYEQGNFITAGRQSYSHLIIWRKDNGEMLRELEMVLEENPGVPRSVLAELAVRRDEWIRLCNLHNAANLVKSLYSENTLYYNHRPMIIGRNSVIQEYEYMNSPNYNLYLSPINVQLVNDEMAFEIGRCSGSYTGNYILIWNKGSDGVWRILMDSNI